MQKCERRIETATAREVIIPKGARKLKKKLRGRVGELGGNREHRLETELEEGERGWPRGRR